jgi:methyltransferase (TIGR00027 family)
MRAKHQVVDGGDIFPDTYALRVLDSDGREMVGEPDSVHAARYRAFMAARSRVADDGLTAARERGVCQVVIPGAGLDTTGFRHDRDDGGVRVFEVDKPVMQDWKRSHLERIGLAPPRSVSYVPMDFERDVLAEELSKAGVDPGAPAFFIWLGVVPYLTADAIRGTLALAASYPAAEIVFDYAEPPENLSAPARAAFEARRRRVAQIGEPWITTFDPPGLHRMLRDAGFSRVDDHKGADLLARYSSRDLRLPISGSGGHVVHARRQ